MLAEIYVMAKNLKRAMWEFHNQNPQVWELFVRFTDEVIRSGKRSYSVNAIFERIRWHTDIETSGSFKICNNHRAYYARYFHHTYPQHDGFFKTKQTKGECNAQSK